MSARITTCGSCPDWIAKALSKSAQLGIFDDEEIDNTDDLANDAQTALEEYSKNEKTRQEREAKEAARAAREAELAGQLIDPSEWGKGGKRPIALKAPVKNKAQKAVHAITKGWHQQIPLGEIFDALIECGLVPIQEDGYKWSGMILGSQPCGSEEANKQQAHFPLVTKNIDGQWAMTTTYLHLSWCTMESGKFELVCYLA